MTSELYKRYDQALSLIQSIFNHGDFKVETFNESILVQLMFKMGYTVQFDKCNRDLAADWKRFELETMPQNNPKTDSVVFLGGTCNESTWRQDLIPMLESAGIKYFDPVVEDWTPECQDAEYEVKNHMGNAELYVITSQMTGVFSIAEAVQASNRKPGKTVFHIVEDGFTESQLKSLHATAKMIQANGGIWVKNFYNIPAACICAVSGRYHGLTD